ncbi:hypothetical protein CYMTET_22744 [Cymbomonas tetramitiformis]|uniref:Uncharacterized protein n=1 Tax=Cymbomonas tetramitiformis TaxID=36881 RepID=A0AAE0L1T6_9CHLO|nr:hypothetical protein CYMTET_22744 [Cymbomonas tetramitiformis]
MATPPTFEATLPIRTRTLFAARENLYKEICERYFNDLMDCKLEDFCVATFLDPRYKHFGFKYLTRWARGTIRTAEKAVGWAKAVWDQDWKSKVVEEESIALAPTAKSRKVERASVDNDEDEIAEVAPGAEPVGANPEAPTASDDFSKRTLHCLSLPVK